ncbi:hypothetical protein LQZ19_11440 [Treponema primitia]|uniref:hypothetical protein n=1 Tax=Treponema primitia TaxID=88058 RepID=UPI00397EE7DE
MPDTQDEILKELQTLQNELKPIIYPPNLKDLVKTALDSRIKEQVDKAPRNMLTGMKAIINDVLRLLISEQQVVRKPRKAENKNIPTEYWINTSVDDVFTFLSQSQQAGIIKIGDVKTFMKTYLKGKKGGLVANSFKTKKSQQQKNRKL